MFFNIEALFAQAFITSFFFFSSLSILQFQKNWWSFTWNWWERSGSLSRQTDGRNIWSRYNVHLVFCVAIWLRWAVVSASLGLPCGQHRRACPGCIRSQLNFQSAWACPKSSENKHYLLGVKEIRQPASRLIWAGRWQCLCWHLMCK